MYATVDVEETAVSEELAAKLPEPTGYELLIALPEIAEKTEGGVFMPDGLKKDEEPHQLLVCFEIGSRCIF